MGALAAVLALAAAALFALGATLWQRASLDAGVEPGDTKAQLMLLTSWVWLRGVAAQTAGVVLQAAALDRGRVAIIQPLLVSSVVFALPLGYFLTGQTIVGRHVLGAAMVVAGLAVFAIVGDPAGGVDKAPTSDWVWALVVVGAVCGALLWFGRGSLGAVATLQGKLEAQKLANAQAQQANDRLANEVRDLKEGLEMVEEKARSELGMVKPNEIFVNVSK